MTKKSVVFVKNNWENVWLFQKYFVSLHCKSKYG